MFEIQKQPTTASYFDFTLSAYIGKRNDFQFRNGFCLNNQNRTLDLYQSCLFDLKPSF